ncbi:bifunctional hydroxymethylpyrimidine kinase/phosphomethylpyrimidine kinase [Bergeriella denitrificans]|uniref:hydroxymethylpyrimidine kinase n=1 Tax=Bergeriella denitrificans TaxID=494 RepID=A0A378UG48_BERDE|nr:bifunctional hydroxymethylpyrimidine kinase/phosphomethylpyrimidine kinase [Bergeriella denitrificans]STZ76140.1 phosphomethylpyrimidine kinase [Bergeriella denitrificans]
MRNIPQALTIAGSDSGGGAGIQADLKTFQMRGVFGTSAITAVTAQNTLGVSGIHLIPTEMITAQLDAVAADFHVSAFKIGMLGDADVIECVAQALQRHTLGRSVLDPVMIAKGGAPLLQQSAVEALKTLLLPLADVVTPNLPEAEALTGIKVSDDKSAQEAASALQACGAKTVVLKGGHLENSQSAVCRDWVFTPEGDFVLESPRIPTRHTHGTGCTFSACIAAELAKGHDVADAVRTAKAFISAAVADALEIGQGHGPTNHWAYYRQTGAI